MPMIPDPKFSDPTPVASKILPEKAGMDLTQAQPSGGGQAPATKYNPYDASVPGQSLTDTPGNANWEHPPQYADPNKAADVVYNQLMKPKNIEQTVAMLRMGTSVEELTKLILFAGFSEGKWTPDTAMLIAKPVSAMIMAIGQRAGIKNMKNTINPDRNKDKLRNIARSHANIKGVDEKSAADRQKELVEGFLPRRNK